jgi:hypothetical protein
MVYIAAEMTQLLGKAGYSFLSEQTTHPTALAPSGGGGLFVGPISLNMSMQLFSARISPYGLSLALDTHIVDMSDMAS